MTEFSTDDCTWMARALRLAANGRFTARPNPMVGCVLVNNGAVVGEGWHVRAGEGHAEVNALREAGAAARDSTAYVTLEPCAHHGRTPPCADALIDAGVSRVVFAMGDPFPEVAGRGAENLRAAGIDVSCGLMGDVAAELNAGFLSRVTRGRPFVRVKLGASLDGAVAMQNGESQWITSAAARADVQRLRAASGAVLTGINTVMADDPSLNVRDPLLDTGAMQPLRVVVDSTLRLSPQAKLLSLPGEVLVACVDTAAAAPLRQAGADVVALPATEGGVELGALLGLLGERGINDLLVEAGPRLAGAMLASGSVDELVIYQAPDLLGSTTRNLVETPNWTSLTDRLSLSVVDSRRIGRDTRLTLRPAH